MDFSEKELEHLEKLSRINLSKDNASTFIKKLGSVIDYVSKLANINTKGVKPTSQVTNLENVLREDIVGKSLSQEDVLKNSKHTYKGYFKIPKVIE